MFFVIYMYLHKNIHMQALKCIIIKYVYHIKLNDRGLELLSIKDENQAGGPLTLLHSSLLNQEGLAPGPLQIPKPMNTQVLI